MTYNSQYRTENKTATADLPTIDPSLVRAARELYHTYFEITPHRVKHPTGVAINRFNYRGNLVFTAHPVLLPEECFVPSSEIALEGR
ncbi:MAG: hypothetical protein KME17_07915 [Cyanosarcina radialis HA8281-LM2]|jgi:hypothetical protein|nr:hypothetical protein [Cyanosarcina radialis HA8281-LM2]